MSAATIEKKTTTRTYVMDVSLERIMRNASYNNSRQAPRASLKFKTGHGVGTLGLHIKKVEPQPNNFILIEGVLDNGKSFTGSYNTETCKGYIDIREH